MNQQKSNHPRARLGSIGFALQGLKHLVRFEPNARLHLFATALAIVAGILQHLAASRWALLAMAIALVWIAEAFNTAIELLCDLWCDGQMHPAIKIIKDLSAAAVLLAAFASLAIGAFVFLG